MNDYKYVKSIEDDIEEYKRLIEKHCALPDVIHKVAVTSDYIRGLKDNGTIDDMIYNGFKHNIQELSSIAWRKCRCETK